jgi:hypothetical protein
MTAPLDLGALAATVARMTEGPFDAIGYVLVAGEPMTQRQEIGVLKLGYENAGNDAAGIVALKNAAPALIAETRALRERVRVLEGALAYYANKDAWDAGCGCCRGNYTESNPAIDYGKVARAALSGE